MAVILCTNNISVHNWLKPYGDELIEGPKSKLGRGRNPILREEHLSIVRASVEQERRKHPTNTIIT